MPIYFILLLIEVSTYNLLPSARYSFKRNLLNKRLVGNDLQHKCQPLWCLVNYSYHLEVRVVGGKPAILYCFSALFLIIPITVSVFTQRIQALRLIDASRELVCLFQSSAAWCRTTLFYWLFNSSCHWNSSKFIPLKVWDPEQKQLLIL